MSKLWCLLLCAGLTACIQPPDPAPAQPETRTYTRSLLAYTAYGSPLARFSFEQTSTDGDPVSSVRLKIENLSGGPFCAGYSVFFRLNLASWSYQGYVRNLDSGEVLDVGTVSTSRARVDLGDFAIRFDTPPVSNC